jgi:hypothetical protein
MRSFLSATVVAATFALLVPDNQSLRAAESYRELPEAAYSSASVPDSASPAAPDAPLADGELGWLLAIGFLAAIVSRRLGAES